MKTNKRKHNTDNLKDELHGPIKNLGVNPKVLKKGKQFL
jgi:hypothetical protein